MPPRPLYSPEFTLLSLVFPLDTPHPPRPASPPCVPLVSSVNRYLPPSPGQSKTDAKAEKVIGLVVEEVVDDAVTPSLWIAWIRSRQTRGPQDKVV